MCLLDVEVLPTIDIAMRIPGWPDMGESALVDRVTFPFELCHGFRHVHGVPYDDGMGDQIEATGLLDAFVATFAAPLALVGDHEGRAQIVKGLTFVELAHDPTPIIIVGIPPEHV